MTTAFVFSGGGSLGAVQVGMVIALSQRGIVPDLVVGTSVGAINAAWVAGRPGLEGAFELAEVWRGVRRDDVFPTGLLTGFLGFSGRKDHLVSPDRLRRLIASRLTFERLEDAVIPLTVVAADITNGLEVALSHGNAVDSIAASAAIPGIFPPVVIEGHALVDGGVTDNAPISHAVEAGADVVYVLPTGYSCALEGPPRSALGVALQALTLLVHQQLSIDAERYRNVVDLRVPPPLCPLSVSPVDFSHTGELIDRARAVTEEWLSQGPGGKNGFATLGIHRH